jgi:hypothetical protein
VPAQDEADTGIFQRVDERHDLAAGHAECVPHTVGVEGLGGKIGNAGHRLVQRKAPTGLSAQGDKADK